MENLFDLSFVVKEGLAQMEVSHEQPVLRFVSHVEKERRLKSKEENHNGQCIIKFNPKTFVDLIDVYQIKHSQIERADEGDEEDESDTVIPNETKRNINSTQRRRKRKRCIENSYTDGDIEQAKHMTNILNEQFTITPNAYVSAVCKEFSDLTVPPISFMNGPLQQCASKTD
eukprot:805247_1